MSSLLALESFLHLTHARTWREVCSSETGGSRGNITLLSSPEGREQGRRVCHRVESNWKKNEYSGLQ